MEHSSESTLGICYLIQQGVEILKPPFDGPANHVREVILELTSRGHRVRVLLGFDGKIWKSDNLQDFESVTVPWLDQGPIHLFERAIRRLQYELQLPYASLFESVRFAQACCQQLHGFDLIYERMSWGNFGGWLAARRCRIPLVLENNGDHLLDLEMKGMAPKGLQLRLSSTMMRQVVLSAALTVVSGDGWRDQFIKRWGASSSHVTTVENGTVLTRILNRQDLRSFSRQIYANTPVKIVYVGGFHPWHGIPILIQAMARVVKGGLDVNLVAIGSGPGQDSAMELVSDLELTNRVDFAGQLTVEQFAPLLAQADIAVASYCGWPELSGLKIFDYKRSSLAFISEGKFKNSGHWVIAICLSGRS